MRLLDLGISVLTLFLTGLAAMEEYVDVLGPDADHHRPPDWMNKRWCHRDWPTHNGTWSDEAPFWVSSPDCPNQAFTQDMTQKCLKGRTIYAMGNSIGRQSVYGVLEMLGGASVKRENQRDACPKHETTWDDSCHSQYQQVKLKYLFMQYMDGFHYENRGGFPFFQDRYKEGNETKYKFLGRQIDPKTGTWGTKPSTFKGGYWEDDNCIGQVTRNCFRRFFKDATKDDIFIFTLGASYVGSHTVDHKEWLRVSAINFKQHIAATFPGQVFRVVLAQPNIHREYAYLESQFKEWNNFLWERAGWNTDHAGCSNEDRPWYTIDQWAINEGRSNMYQDHLHFNGKLTHAMLHQVLNEMCPAKFWEERAAKQAAKQAAKDATQEERRTDVEAAAAVATLRRA